MSDETMTQKALAALESAVRKVIADHAKRGRPMAVWVDGRVVLISAETMLPVREDPGAYTP